jgi:hypothetical protein
MWSILVFIGNFFLVGSVWPADGLVSIVSSIMVAAILTFLAMRYLPHRDA